jgi:site-specific DNA recombinase
MKDDNTLPNHTQAVIYTRVSSVKQTTRGDGLSSQETRCREYARYKGYDVLKVFKDDMTGSLVKRPGMQAMLAFLRKSSKKQDVVVIIDDISRLARGIEAHIQLRSTLAKAGGKLESPSIEFGDDPDSRFVEHLMATVAQHQREKNGEQTINRMRARVMNGYWVFQAPMGYRYQRVSGQGNMLVKDEPHASLLKEALEGFATGRFDSQVEVKRFLESQPDFPKDLPNGQIRNQRIKEFLTRPLYAGYIEAPNWNVSLRKGKHEPLISMETFDTIQDRLNKGTKAPIRKDIKDDFPLRGFVTCAECGNPLTACWSKSSTGKKHPYYFCFNRECSANRKSIPRKKVETAFEGILESLHPSETLYNCVKTMFKTAWSQRLKEGQTAAESVKREIKAIDQKIENLLDRIVDADQPSVINAYEKRIAELEKDKLLKQSKLENGNKPKHSFEQMFELAMMFLANPYKLWVSGNLKLQRIVLRLAFAERIAFCRNEGFRTPQVSVPFTFFENFKEKNKMARSRRLELPRVLSHSDLNAARLPIPPRPQIP